MRLDFDVEPLNDLITKLRSMGVETKPAVQRSIRLGMALLERTVKDNISGPILYRRTGNLAKSIRTDVGEEGEMMYAALTTDNRVPYALIHERGGTITPKKARHLYIPAGQVGPKSSARPQGQTAESPREWFNKGMFLWPTKKSGKGEPRVAVVSVKGRLRVIFILKKSVTIPARRYIARSIESTRDQIQTLIRDALLDAYAQSVKQP